MKVEVLSILPGLMRSYLQEGVLGRGLRAGLLHVDLVNIRDFAADRHHSTDYPPYGGGAGQVMAVEPLAAAVRALPKRPKPHVIFLTPDGAPFTDAHARRLAKRPHLVFVCGRYEGVDQRFRDRFVDEELSIGDYVLAGGELAALVVIEAVARYLPGVLGNAESAPDDSFARGLLDYPCYTKPRVFEGAEVPSVLLGGDHKAITAWRERVALERTRERRPDLLPAESVEPAQNTKTRKKAKKS